MLDSADSGRSRAYVAGIPDFDMETIVRMLDDAPSIAAYLSIPLSSLVFVQSGGGFAAEYEVTINIIDRDSENLVREAVDSETILLADYDSTLLPVPHHRIIDLAVGPGSYVVEAAVIDQATGERVVRRQAAIVPDDKDAEPFLGRIHLEARGEDERFEPVVALHVPGKMDSLRASIQLLNLAAVDELTLTMELVKFVTDTSIAKPPYWLDPSRASIVARGIFIDNIDTIQVSRRTISTPDSDLLAVFTLPELNPGIYRLKIDAVGDSDRRLIASRDRMLSVKSDTYPQVATLDDLIDALAYIAYNNEIEHIKSADTNTEAKRRFDAFWAMRAPNRNVAANLIKLYYGRVEEANLLFTGYKEGWKTDRGMVYVVMGPPLYVDRRVESETWHYSYGDRDPANSYQFEKVRSLHQGGFDNYILQRRPYYQHEWTRAVDLWRRGNVL